MESEMTVGNKVYTAYTVLREKIISGVYEYGRVLSANALSSELNMSRTPILEAFKLLERDEMVSVIPQVGVIVNPLNIKDIIGRYEVLAELEGYLAEQAAVRCAAKDKETLEQLLSQMEQSLQDKDEKNMMELNKQYHDSIREIARKPFARNLCQQLRRSQDWHRIMQKIVFNPDNNRMSFEEHLECSQAIINHDIQKAREIMKQHVLRTRLQVLKQLIES